MAPEVVDVVRRPSRLRALAELGANAQSSAEALDRIARTACRVLKVPVALVNLVGADRQHFVGCQGPEPWPSMREMPLTAGFCPFTLGAGDSFSFADARVDPALAVNAAVEQYGVVAYAGVPLRAADGEPIGTLCAIDYEPRPWSPDDLGLLADLAAGVVAELQLLTATRLLARDQARLRALAELSSALVAEQTAREVLDAVVRAIDRPHPDAAWLLTPDESGQALRTAAATGEREVEAPLTATPGFLTTRADVRSRFDVLAGAAAVLPLAAAERPVGALIVSFAHEREFSDGDRAYLAAVGGVAGLALARAR
jgi:GAF domain-containing protein